MLLCEGMNDELVCGTVTEWLIENSTLVEHFWLVCIARSAILMHRYNTILYNWCVFQ